MVENKFNIELSLVSHYTKLTYFNAKTSTTQKKNTSFSTIQKTFSVKCWEKLSNLTHFRSIFPFLPPENICTFF